MSANPSGDFPEPWPALNIMVGTRTTVRMVNSLNMLGPSARYFHREDVAEVRYMFPWVASRALDARVSETTPTGETIVTRKSMTYGQAAQCSNYRDGDAVCSHLDDSFLAKAASLVTAALQVSNTTRLTASVKYLDGVLTGVKPSAGFLGVMLAVTHCRHNPVDLYYFKPCEKGQAGAAPICLHPGSPMMVPAWYCKLTTDERIMQSDGSPGRYNINYQRNGSSQGCLKIDHAFEHEQATYQLLQACGMVTLHT